MTMQPRSILKTLVLAGLVVSPLAAGAQGTRQQPARPAPAPVPRASAAPAPAPTPVATPAPVTTAAPTATTPTPAARASSAIVTTHQASTEDYRLGAGDKLRIEVYREPQLSQSLQIRPDGKITLPLIGDLPAAGKTSLELRDTVTSSLREYVNNPNVTVIVQEATSNQIYVMGEVVTSGPQVLMGPTTALQAIAQAGGLKEFAKKGSIHVLRKTASGTRTLPFDYKGALKGEADPLPLQPGDTVVVP